MKIHDKVLFVAAGALRVGVIVKKNQIEDAAGTRTVLDVASITPAGQRQDHTVPAADVTDFSNADGVVGFIILSPDSKGADELLTSFILALVTPSP